LLLFGIAICTHAQQLNVDDVFVAVQGGYQVFDPSGATAKAFIATPSNSAFTAGCAFDSTYRLRTTIFSGAEVVRYAIPSSFSRTQTLEVSASPDSIVFDGHNNFFVGHAGGHIEEFDASGTSVGSFDVKVDAQTFISLDLSADGNKLFYTSGGSTIRTFNLSSHATSKITVGGLNGANLFGIRLLSPFDGSGGFLVATGKNILKLNGSGSTVLSYVAAVAATESSNNWRALAFASNGGQFWGVNLATGHLFKFNVGGGKAAGPIDTNASTDGGQSGVCVDGAFSAAQPTPIKMVASPALTSTSNFTQFTLTSPGTPLSLGNSITSNSTSTNQVNVTVNFDSASSPSVTVTAWFTEIDPVVGTSDPSPPAPAPGKLACLVVDQPSATNKCAVVKLEFTPDDPLVFRSANLGLLTTQNSINPVFLADEENSDTTFVIHGSTFSGGTRGSTVFSLQEQPLSPPAGGEVSCGYQTPVTTSPSDFPNSNTIPLKFATATTLANCIAGNFLNSSGLKPSISLVLLDPNNLTGTLLFTSTAGNSSGPFPQYRQSPPSTWIININTTGLPDGCYIATTTDATNQMASFSYSSQTNPKTVIIGVGSAMCTGITLP
jgi:hypothetical protein